MRVFAASDLSDASDEALRQAYAGARAASGTLAVCHVIPHPPPVHALFPQEYERDIEKLTQAVPDVEALVRDRISAVLGPEAEAEIKIVAGEPYAEIVRQAETWSADRIVVGSIGRTGLARLLLGSVAERVVQYAHCSVLVARSSPSGAVLVGTDLSESSMPALSAGVREASARNRQLIVLYASEIVTEYLGGAAAMFGLTPPMPPIELVDQRHAAARQLIADALARAGGSGEIVVAEEPAEQAILRRAETLPAELVVVGTRGRTGLSRVMLGSVAERVVRGAHCSVLVAR
jgi:nucleotide-binding universal stress UspA family protein